MSQVLSGLIVFLMASSFASAQRQPPPPPPPPPVVPSQGPFGPSLALKPEVVMQGTADDRVTATAWRATVNAYYLMVPPTSPVPAPSGLASIQVAMELAEMPAGIYVVRLENKGDDLRFELELGPNRPEDCIVFAPKHLQVTKNADASNSFKLPKPLPKGKYAVYITNNQYAWPFEVK